jgi:cysteine-rich repeat protein
MIKKNVIKTRLKLCGLISPIRVFLFKHAGGWGKMRIETIATGLAVIFIIIFGVNIALAENEVVISEISADKVVRMTDDVDLLHQTNSIQTKQRPSYTNTLESIIELCNLYELTNHPPPLFCLNCGNGILEPSEQCDDGNSNKSDGCNADCLLEIPQPHAPAYWLEFNA